jgi:hypothetical protein
MSIEALSWALNLAPIPTDTNGARSAACTAVLVGLANHADPKGRHAFPSVETLMRYTSLSERTIRTSLARLLEAGVIQFGDEDIVAAHVKRADRRPNGYDLNLHLVDQTRGAAVAPRSESRGATTAATGCNERTYGVQPTTVRGAVVAPEPSSNHPEPSREPSRAAGAVAASQSDGTLFAIEGGGKPAKHPAQQILDDWWERQAPRPSQPYVAALKVVKALVKQHGEDLVRHTLMHMRPPLSGGAFDMTLNRTPTLLPPKQWVDGEEWSSR